MPKTPAEAPERDGLERIAPEEDERAGANELPRDRLRPDPRLAPGRALGISIERCVRDGMLSLLCGIADVRGDVSMRERRRSEEVDESGIVIRGELPRSRRGPKD